jgi:hypothetical protein
MIKLINHTACNLLVLVIRFYMQELLMTMEMKTKKIQTKTKSKESKNKHDASKHFIDKESQQTINTIL